MRDNLISKFSAISTDLLQPQNFK